ncbi:MAG: hypothetical protein ACLQVI_23675 [Polyangiaceae bacterium]
MSTLESSVTLDDVFVVVGAKRVPLAPELAGYLALEIAEGATQAAGDVDPRSVYIGEEGSVALVVRPRREGRSAEAGDAEGSIRVILTRLLEASGSQTPALASVARRQCSGLNTLVEELEAALIPVNRAAGRRALARLAREVKRVTLGVGRNASLAPGEPAPRRASSPAQTAVREGAARPPQEEPRPVPRSGFTEEPPTTARREVLPDPMAYRPREEPATVSSDAPVTRSTSPDASELPTIEVRKEHILDALGGHAATTRGAEAATDSSSPNPPVARQPAPDAAAPPGRKTHHVDEVDHLLESFGVSSRGEQSQRNELKALVGLEPTPPPPGSEHAFDAPRRHTASESDVESLLAYSDAGPPVAPAAPAGERDRAARSVEGGTSSRGLSSPPTAISPALANEPFGGSGHAAPSADPPAPRLAQPRSAARPAPEAAASEATDPSTEGVRAVPTSPSARRLAEMGSQSNIAPPPDRSLTVFAFVILIAGGAAIWFLRPALFGGHEPTPAPAPVAASAAPPLAARCRASLTVTDAPVNAEILVRAGQAPVDVEKMPVGARLEFVATAEGYAPKRAVVPSGASWDTGPDGKPRYEVAVQLDRSHARPGAVDSWPAGEPGTEVGGKGSPGTVHLVTTPRGAEVWQLAGLGPDALFDVKCGGEIEVLVAGPTTLRKRLHIAESEFVAIDGGPDKQASVSAGPPGGTSPTSAPK